MPYEEDGGDKVCVMDARIPIFGETSSPAGRSPWVFMRLSAQKTWAGSAEGCCRRNPAGVCDGTGGAGR